MRRHAIGIISLLLLLLGGFLYFRQGEGGRWAVVSGAAVRMGAVLFAVWLALPQVRRVPRWVYACVGTFLILVAIRREFLFLVIPVLFIYWLFQPYKGRQMAKPAARTVHRGNAKKDTL